MDADEKGNKESSPQTTAVYIPRAQGNKPFKSQEGAKQGEEAHTRHVRTLHAAVYPLTDETQMILEFGSGILKLCGWTWRRMVAMAELYE